MKRSLLLFIFLTIFLLFINLFMYFIMPENLQINIVTSGVVFLFGVMLFFPLRKTIVNVISPYDLKFYINELVGVVLVFFIFVVVNFVTNKNDVYWDLTTNKINTLSIETKSILNKIDKEIEINLFASQSQKKKYIDLLKLYQMENQKLKVVWKDPNLNQNLVNQHLLVKEGDLLIRQENSEFIKGTARSEGSITLALKKLVFKPIPLYLLSDHGTPVISRDGQNSRYSFISRLLENEGFNLIRVTLSQITRLRGSSSFNVLMLDPSVDFTSSEVISFSSWFNQPGQKNNLIMFLGSRVDEVGLPNLREWLKNQFGITFQSNLLVDQLAKLNNLDSSIIQAKNTTKLPKMIGDKNFYPLGLGVNLEKPQIDDFSSIDILQQTDSFPAVWGETNFKSVFDNKVSFNEGKDLKGPFPLSFKMSNKAKTKKLLFFASAQLISNAYKGLSSNYHLVLNLFNREFNQQSPVIPKRLNIRDNKILINQVHLNIMIYFSIICLPLAFLIWSLANYLRRLKYQ
ncbi:GldG family protein [Bacteriovoracaceae bacterium]|nr:GldG family protein [Bacteriovoracaceae bacterium]